MTIPGFGQPSRDPGERPVTELTVASLRHRLRQFDAPGIRTEPYVGRVAAELHRRDEPCVSTFHLDPLCRCKRAGSHTCGPGRCRVCDGEA